MVFIPFPPRQPSSSARLSLTLTTLDDRVLATISGSNSKKYLQGQITADVSNLTDAQHLLAAYCDAKGKMWSNLCVFCRDGGFAWTECCSLCDAQLTELRKHVVFSKITITTNDNLVLLGVASFQVRVALAPSFAALPDAAVPVVSEGATSLLWFEHLGECFLLATDVDTANRVTDTLRGEAQLNNSQQWLAPSIEAGLPVIDNANSGQFIPQATSLQALGGISFREGCYISQEMVTRAKFCGANKRALQTLSGAAGRVPEAGEDLELKMGDNWRRTKTVLAATWLGDGQLLAQVVINNNMKPDGIFRACDDAGSPVPYAYLRAHETILSL